MIEHKNIKELKVGDRVSGYYIMRKYSKGGNANTSWGNVTLGDLSGTIDSKLWSPDPNVNYEEWVGQLVFINAELTKKGNFPESLNFTKLELAKEEDLREHGIDIKDYIVKGALDPISCYNRLHKSASSLSDGYREITLHILEKYRDELLVAPAAMSVHHDIHGGLIWHTTEMLILAEAISNVVNNVYKTWGLKVDQNLLYAGVILHDIMKVKEMAYTVDGSVSDYTQEGKSLGHIYMIAREVNEVGKKLNVDSGKLLKLESILLSHHGKLEYGSPVKPNYLEGILLHQIDGISADVNVVMKALQQTDQGEYTQRLFSIENAQIFKSDENEE